MGEAHLAVALKVAEVGTWELDLATRLVRCSDIADDLYGLSHSNEPRHAAEYVARIHPADRERVTESIVAAVSDSAEYAIEFRILLANRVRWVSSRGEVVRGADGSVTHLVSAIVDITERTWAKERLELLAAVGTLLNDALDPDLLPQRLVDLLVPRLADRSAIYVHEANGAARALAWSTVRDADAVMLKQILAQPVMTPERLPIHRVLEDGQPLLLRADELQSWLDMPSEAELSAALPSLASHEALIAPLLARGRTIGVLSCVIGQGRSYDERDLELLRDVASRAALVLDNARLYQEAQQAIHSRDTFITVASHDLRSPLTVLLGQAQMLEKRAVDDGLSARGLRAVQSIREQSSRLDRMIGALLDLSRIQTGRLTLDVVPVDVGALVMRVAGELQPGLNRHVITVVGPEAQLVLLGDELRLEQALQNLLDNAVKYSPGGGTVVVRVYTTAEHAVVAVSDQGLGITDDALPRVFEQFYRAPSTSARTAGGLGVGLYIVREIVNLHGGMVAVESQEGIGSTFTVSLPLTRDEQRGASCV